MDQFLAGQRAEGVAESVGTFTIDGRKARAKMANQLADPGAYVLKLVQAAIALRSPEITVKISRLALSLEFSTPAVSAICPHEVANSLGRVATLERGPLRHLAVGVNAAFGPNVDEVHWETGAGGISLSEEGILPTGRTAPGFRCTIRKRRPLFPWFRGSFYVDEIECLSQRCTYVPSRLLLDGRVIYRPIWNRFGYSFESAEVDAPSFPFEYRAQGGNGFWLAYPPGRWYQADTHQRQRWNQDRKSAMIPSGAAVPYVIQGWDGQARSKAASALVGLPHRTIGAGRIIPILDGVRMQPITGLDLGYPGAQVVLDASHLGTDLSELALIKDRSYEDLVSEARSQVADALRSFTG